MLATAVFAEGEEQILDAEKWTKRPVNRYSVARFEETARTVGLNLIRLGKVFQDRFVVFKEGNHIALRGAEDDAQSRMERRDPEVGRSWMEVEGNKSKLLDISILT